MFLRIDSWGFRQIINSLLRIEPNDLQLCSKFEKDTSYNPSSNWEKYVMYTLCRLNVVSTELPGSLGYKLGRRNEIRAFSNRNEALASALFITITPSDIHNFIVRLLVGLSISLEEPSIATLMK
jgi:hypothetical protein